jgi:hypothetical protein
MTVPKCEANEPEAYKTVYHCGQYNKDLSRRELKLHGCFYTKKGRNKGRICRQLVIYTEKQGLSS